MEDQVFQFFKTLTDNPSPSGFEQPAQRAWRDYVASHVDRVATDVMGSSWGVIEGPERPRVMLAGHVDEIGLMVRYIDDDGFLFFAPIGGVDAHLLPGQESVEKRGTAARVADDEQRPLDTHLPNAGEKDVIERHAEADQQAVQRKHQE